MFHNRESINDISNKCADCSTYISCNVMNYGQLIELNADENKIKRCDSKVTTVNTLDKCLPRVYRIHELLEGFICFWTPQMGCTIVIGKRQQQRNYTENYCEQCLSHCPCSEGSRVHIGLTARTICIGLVLGLMWAL
ncbi:uncharacterized protein LOC115763157 isoform X1 [Drosophila novamexicana]|uniref:uncharacterized protein LOC115763157 isoform X1 n=1 Tax=Drosophila novamexicana TaxID=47314 RepID=UPI0011E5D874|nr:uncharacterized protein LOC115763157 isoform X1 [Drosophila novamexicana]